MKVEEYADEMIEKYKKVLRADNRSWEVEAIACAITTVDVLISTLRFEYMTSVRGKTVIKYFKNVKKELEKRMP